LNKGRWKDNVKQAVTNIKTKSLEEQLKELEDGSRSKANAN
jgi:DNA-binding HxlR family transcriptional regulator